MNMIPTNITLTKEAEDYLKDLVAELEVPEGRYEAARARYASLGKWLHRDESTVAKHAPQIYAQGSFRLGTAIKPSSESEEYDVDSICLCKALGKETITQHALKILVGQEIDAYRKANRMEKPLVNGRRCWVLSYADSAQFHMDIVPAVPNGTQQQILLETAGKSNEWASLSVGITDNETAGYYAITDDWQRSNPKGYSRWFKQRATVLYERMQKAAADSVRASVENIPTFKLKLPLQAAIMILKGHRNHMFADRSDCAPISIIITMCFGLQN
ncbi:Nucleotidyltransferase (fragment) [Beijerinckiaceae bacterium RH AL1]